MTPATIAMLLRLRQATQAWLLMAGANRKTRRRARVPSPGYDELRSPCFLVVMALAIFVLVVDVGDRWPAVIALLGAALKGA